MKPLLLLSFLFLFSQNLFALDLFECSTEVNHGVVADGYIVKARKSDENRVVLNMRRLTYYFVEEFGDLPVENTDEGVYKYFVSENEYFNLQIVPGSGRKKPYCLLKGQMGGRELNVQLGYKPIDCTEALIK